MPAPEERVIVATLQRMYRHFYFRVCDIVNTAALLESGQLDFAELKKAADLGGIWPGVATYLKIVCDYVREYRGEAPELPEQVLAAARFGGEVIFARGKFLRVPIMPNGADLYTRQVTQTALRGDVPATLRLSLLPYLASAAAVAFRITGSEREFGEARSFQCIRANRCENRAASGSRHSNAWHSGAKIRMSN